MTRNAQETIEYIQTIEELSDQEKKQYTDMINSGADLVDVLDQVEDALQKKINSVFEEAGVTLDENDPEYQKEHEKMLAELQSAEDEFNETMGEIETDVNKFQEETIAETDKAKIEAIRSDIAK